MVWGFDAPIVSIAQVHRLRRAIRGTVRFLSRSLARLVMVQPELLYLLGQLPSGTFPSEAVKCWDYVRSN